MAKLFGALNLNDTEYIFSQIKDQRIIWDAAQDVITRYNQDLQNVLDLFVSGTTSDFKWRFKLPGFGTLQEEGQFARSGAVKSGGSWDVALPLKQYGDAFAWDDVTMGYMTMQEFDLHFQTILNDDAGTMRILLLNALFLASSYTFKDKLKGDLTIMPLANQDGTLYPANPGSTVEAEQNVLLASGYAASAISDANDPVLTLVNKLEDINGAPTGGSNIWVFINDAQTAKIKALTDFVGVTEMGIQPGSDVTTLIGMPAVPPNMRLLGKVSGGWIFEWRRMPENYMIAIPADAQRPLTMRVDPSDTGLAGGLTLHSTDLSYPFTNQQFRRRVGMGVTNRLGAAIMFLDAGSTYVAPTITL